MRVASLFAGIGGICLGFKQAGHEIIWANEKDCSACRTYRNNFGTNYLVEKDILHVKCEDIPEFDILVAGFPCQPFSIAGLQKGFEDPRGNLFFIIANIIKHKKPEVVFLENVDNLLRHDNGNTFSVIKETLTKLGYYITYRVMSADGYGNLPQVRKRVFIVGFKNKEQFHKFEFPKPIELQVGINDIIIRDNKKADFFYYKNKKEEMLREHITDMESIYRLTDTGIRKVKDRMCPTLTANMGTYPDRVPIIRDKYGIRKMTIRECLEMQGFPKEFFFPTTITINDAYKQIGNSVAVPVVRRIAERLDI